jgi:hypothetical protein
VPLPDHRFAKALPASGPALVLGWESRLGPLADEGTLAGRWDQEGPGGDSVVVRIVDAEPPRSRASTPSSTASGMN